MKWKDLSLKERKQIYDSVRVNNPDATYLDIKQQFDSIPAYEDGKGKTINKADLPPEYRTGTPEYFERQRKISGAVNTVQPEAYITPAGYIKDAVNFIEDLGNGDYTGAAIAMRDMTNRGKYLSWGTMDNNAFGNTKFKIEPDGNTSRVMQDYNVTLNPDSYMSGTANHELGHVADGLAGSRKIVDFDGGGEYITNPYLHYLANPNNTYSSAELRKMGMHSAANNRAYLLNPTEAKSHMLTLKRALKDSGKITNWSTPIDESMVLEYIKSPTPNKLIKDQYNLYRNKNEYIERLNKLIPMEILMPLGGAGFVGNELNKE